VSTRVRFPIPKGEFQYVDCPECGQSQWEVDETGKVWIAHHVVTCSLMHTLVVAIKEQESPA
jgi:ribosomal protein S27E